MFDNVDQKRVFKELNGEIPSERAIPNAKESSKCWGKFREMRNSLAGKQLG